MISRAGLRAAQHHRVDSRGAAAFWVRDGEGVAMRQAFWLDEQFDRQQAPDGRSRFGAEVRRRAEEFSDAWGDIAPVRFAVTAWRLATTLSPGYVRWHRRVLSAICLRSPWDGSLTCEVNLVGPWPAELTWSK